MDSSKSHPDAVIYFLSGLFELLVSSNLFHDYGQGGVHVEGRSKDVNVGGVTDEVVNSLEIGSVVLHIEVVWDARGGHSNQREVVC